VLGCERRGLVRISKKHFLISIEEFSRDVGEQRVTITVTLEKVLNSLEFNLTVDVSAADIQQAIGTRYGHC